MTLPRTKTIRFRMLALPLLGIALLGGCAPEPEPAPTPTAAFADEEEAFAAAEAVYRAYLDEVASFADGDMSAAPARYLSGDALEAHLANQNALAERELQIIGPTTLVTWSGIDAAITEGVALVRVNLCLDISESRVLDATGTDVTPAERPSRGSLVVEFSGDSDVLLITQSEAAEDSAC